MERKINLLLISITILFSSCSTFRAIKNGNPAIDDYIVFPQDTIYNSSNVFTFEELPIGGRKLDTLNVDVYFSKSDTFKKMTLNEVVEYTTKPAAAIIIKNDTIIYEHYSGGLNKDSQTTVFSVTKTITSILCGVALKDGYIESVKDPVTKYIPELKKKDKMFQQLTIEHLLDMSAGLKFEESYSFNPFSKIAQLYYGNNSLDVISGMKFINVPGERYHYDSMTTAILGIVIERATGVPYAKYLSEKLWQPLGMEQSATISLDSQKHHNAKSYAGLTTNVRDLAKIGKLYIDKGNWDGVQIVDSTYVERSHSKNFVGANHGTYSYSWYWGTYDHKKFDDVDSMYNYYKSVPNVEACAANRSRNTGKYKAVLHRGSFWAYGLYGQVLYVNPEKNIIAVYLGADRIEDFYNIFDRLLEQL